MVYVWKCIIIATTHALWKHNHIYERNMILNKAKQGITVTLGLKLHINNPNLIIT